MLQDKPTNMLKQNPQLAQTNSYKQSSYNPNKNKKETTKEQGLWFSFWLSFKPHQNQGYQQTYPPNCRLQHTSERQHGMHAEGQVLRLRGQQTFAAEGREMHLASRSSRSFLGDPGAGGPAGGFLGPSPLNSKACGWKHGDPGTGAGGWLGPMFKGLGSSHVTGNRLFGSHRLRGCNLRVLGSARKDFMTLKEPRVWVCSKGSERRWR